jgi:hypothetical protein
VQTKANGRTVQTTRLAVALSGASLFDLAHRAMNQEFVADKKPLIEELKKLPAVVGMPLFKEIMLGEYDEKSERQKHLWR